MDLATAPSPKNKAIQLKELPSHRAIARYLHGPPQHGPLIVAGVAGGAAAHLPLAGLLGLRFPRPHSGCARDAPPSRYRAQWEAAAAQGREPAEPRPDVAVCAFGGPFSTDLLTCRPVSPDEMLARQKSEMLPLVNELCGELGSSKLSTAAGSERPRWQLGSCARAPAAALGSSALPGRGPGTERPATASGAPARRLQSRQFQRV